MPRDETHQGTKGSVLSLPITFFSFSTISSMLRSAPWHTLLSIWVSQSQNSLFLSLKIVQALRRSAISCLREDTWESETWGSESARGTRRAQKTLWCQMFQAWTSQGDLVRFYPARTNIAQLLNWWHGGSIAVTQKWRANDERWCHPSKMSNRWLDSRTINHTDGVTTMPTSYETMPRRIGMTSL